MTVSINDIDLVLPQTQCGDCGYSGCLPYAAAIASQNATIDKCLPGGVKVLEQLGQLTEQDITPYYEEMLVKAKPNRVAIIHESACIGCTKCIQACPVDAIFGTSKKMHTVIMEECTGCGLCVPPCPMDCIEMVVETKQTYDSAKAKNRFIARNARLQKTRTNEASDSKVIEDKKSLIQAAVERAKQKKLTAGLKNS